MTEAPFGNLRVLIVDDSHFAHKLLHDMLHVLQIHDIQDAGDGAGGLKIMQEGFDPGLIITDYEMPVIDGVEFTRTVRASRNIKNHNVPVIMVTSHTDEDHVRSARDAGVDEFLKKPFSEEMLIKRMKAAIEKPREFIESSVYIGPDRRRKWDLDFDGDDKRKDDGRKDDGQNKG